MKTSTTFRPARGSSLAVRILALSSVVILASQHMYAADTNGTWITNGNGSWSDADTANWTDGLVADGSGYTADFNTLDLAAELVVSLAAPRTIGNLIFGDITPATAYGWTLDNAATPANILTLAGATPTITVNALGTANLALTLSPKSLIMSGVIAGTSGLTKAGDGRLKLTGTSNTYTGGTVINGGRLSILGENSLGANPVAVEAANITINNGGVLELTALLDADGNGSSVTLSANRGITLGTGVQILQRNHRSQNFGVNGIITGDGGLVLSTAANGDQGGGSGWSINGANTHTGDTYLGWSSGQNKGCGYSFGTLALQYSTLNYVNYFGFTENLSRENAASLPTNATLGGLAGGVNSGQVKTLSVPSGLKVGNNNQDTTFSGKLLGGGSLEKIGNGKLTLTRSDHTYTGATTVSAGTLALGASASINNSSSVTLKPGAVLDTTAKTPYAIPALKTYAFQIDGSGSGSCGSIKATGLDITNATVTFPEITTPDDPVYVLADYTSLTGTAFASATPPPNYTIDYAYNGGTQIALVGSSSPPAQIVVKQGATTLVNNGDTVDFGPVAMGTYADLVFTIENSGTINLDLTGPSPYVVVGGTNSGDFTVMAPPVTPVAGTPTNFTIRFAPGLVNSSRAATLTITSNSASDSSFVINVGGAGIWDYDIWKLGYSGDMSNGADPDFDGMSNFNEYAFGLNPNDSRSCNPISVPFAKAAGTFSYTRRDPSLTGISYKVFTSETMQPLSWSTNIATAETPGAVGLDGIQTVAVTLAPSLLSGTRLFIRVEATQP
jgi:autotransporter-associated beta strand protein